MKEEHQLLLVFAFCVAVGAPSPARSADIGEVVYQNSFEKAADKPFIELAENSWPATLAQAVDDGDATDGESSLLFSFRFRKPGHCYPMMRFDKPVPVGESPLFFSGYLKVEEQHPEAFHNWRLAVYGEFPKQPTGWKGFELRLIESKVLPNGWVYFWSDDLREACRKVAAERNAPFDGAHLTGYYVLMWNARPGEVVRYRLDNVRLTRFNPIPQPEQHTYQAAVQLYELMVHDKPYLEGIADEIVRSFVSGLTEATALLRNDDAKPDAFLQSLFVGKIRSLERIYWRLKVIDLCVEK